jgi:nucleoside-triphosphatase THEP1
MAQRRITIVCGVRDSGKTRTAGEMAAKLRGQGLGVGGVLSIAELRDGAKVGYAFLDCATGASMPYARRRPEPPGPGRLAFELLAEGLAFGAAAVRAGIADGADALFVDEIGPLEMSGQGLWEPLREARAAHAGRLVVTVRPSLLEELVTRLGIGPDEAEVIRLPDPGGPA